MNNMTLIRLLFFAYFRGFSYITQDTKRRWFGETLWKYLRD
nr:MAG TPA: hypothetical protein [Caudoviricetes sp.]